MANLITPKFRASFVHLNSPRSAAPGAPEKYSMVIVLEQDNKEHMAFLDKLKQECLDAAKEKFGNKVPKKLRLPFKDGDDSERDEWAGCVVFTASASQEYRPGVVNADREPIIDPDEIYSGMYCRASVNAFAWEHPTGGKGVSIGLNAVQKIADGDRFGGGVSAENAFPEWADDEDD